MAGLHVTSTMELEPILEAILNSALHLVGGTNARIFLYDGRRLALGAAAGPEELRPEPDAEPRPPSTTYSVARTGERVVIPDVRSHPLVEDGEWDERHAAAVGLPLKVGDQVEGVMTIAFDGTHEFGEDELSVLELLGDQAAIAIENARLYRDAQRHVEELTALHNIDVAITSTLSFEEVLERIHQQISKVMDIGTFYIGLYHKSRNELSLPLVVDQGIRADPSTLDLRDGGGLAGWVVRNTEPVWVNNWEKEQDALPSAAVVQGFPTGSLMVLPLVARDEVIGVISAQSPKPGVFDKGHRRLFSGIAHQVAIAVENARLFEEARRRLADVESLQEVTLAAVSTLDFDLVLERTVRALHRTLGIDRLGFLLPNERGDMLEPHPSLVGFANSGFQVPVAGSLAGRAYRSGQLALVRDLRDGEVEFDQEAEIRSALAVPVRIGSRIVAVLRAESPEVGAFGEDEVRLFTTLAGQLGVVLESARLYQRLEEQRDELGQAYEELRKVDRLRTELVQNVSHELRTPFSLVQGYIELMANEDLGPLLQEQQAALKIIANRVSILEHLIHDLTTLDETSRKEAQSRATCIVETMESALEEFKLRANRAGIRFRREMPEATPKVLADQGQLLRAFSHLLDNAIKFSPAGGTVTICAWEQDDQSCISVADEGIGIPAEHLDHIFERFYQVDGGMSRRFGGMGIGLALVSEIVEAHGGSVEVESTPQKGSTFTVALPQVELDDQPDG